MKLQEAIEKRRTLKVLADKNVEVKDISLDVQEIIKMGGKAPFHYINATSALKNLKSLAPWRFYVLEGESCRKLSDFLIENNIDGGKIINMLRAAQTLIQVTWTPEKEVEPLLASNSNIEHIAATSAAIQNMLLTATSLGYENYWSSGGVLRETFIKEHLKIPTDELLLASLFLFDQDTASMKTKKGALRGRQGDVSSFSKTIHL